jgi:adenylate cyclase
MEGRPPTGVGHRIGTILDRLISFADEPSDDDDARLRKRVGILAGYINVVLPLQLPLLSQGLGLSWFVAIVMPLVSATNLLVLARTRRFDRYVVVLILTVLLFPAVVEIALGGIGGASAGYLFAFLGPVYAILALGPRRATSWFVAFLLLLLAVILLDPIISSRIAPQPYPLRLAFYFANLAVPLGITFLMLRYTDVRRRQAQALADQLLTNAIPVTIAARLKRGETRIAESYPATTVLFADLASFTPWAQGADPDHVISALDGLFTRFDVLAAEHRVEKIKTLGDAYMAVAGAPEPMDDHAAAAIRLAQAMLQAFADSRVALGLPLELRVGMASGPVVGGVIGQQRILFDLWGDTVNTASRMQSSGLPGRIQVAPTTWTLTKDDFAFEERAIEVKGLGPMVAYLLIVKQTVQS